MKVKNKSKGLIVLTVATSAGRRAIQIPAGKTVEDKDLQDKDVEVYVNEKSLEVIDSKEENKGAKDENKETLDPVVLPEQITRDTLKKMDLKDLKRWCKEQKLKNYSKLKEDEVITMILDHLKIEEPPAGETKEEGKGEE